MSKRHELEPNNSYRLIIPCGRRWLASWMVSRFGFHNRKIFWLYCLGVTPLIFVSSGILLNVCIQMPLYMFAGLPATRSVFAPIASSEIAAQFKNHVHELSKVSPIDSFIRLFSDAVSAALRASTSEEPYILVGIISFLVWSVIVFKLIQSPSQMVVSPQGISLDWKILFFKMSGPVIGWNDLTGITFHRRGTDDAPDGKIDVRFRTPCWEYRWLKLLNAGCRDAISIDLKYLEAEHRRKLSEMFQQYAPPNIVSPDVAEILTEVKTNSFTELWMQALTAGPKRESLEPLPVGKQLKNGSYTIRGQVGIGGQGTAYAAQQSPSRTGVSGAISAQTGAVSAHTGADSANDSTGSNDGAVIDLVVKEFVLPLYVDSNSRKEALRKFMDEADLLQKLDHNRVVKLTDCFVEDHRGYIVLERIHGESLKELVTRTGAISESRVTELLMQMIDVLKYLHGQSPPVVHRDFAPDNLILGSDGVLKLVDFNVAQQADNSMTGTIVGKPSYVAPEQLRGMATPASDIYSLGATLFFLLTGMEPEPLAVSRPKAVAPHVSAQIDDLIAKCTALNEAERLSDIAGVEEYVLHTIAALGQELV